MSDLPVLPLWVTKYEGNTAHLSLEEDGAYTRLLRLCWRTPGCSVPADAAWVMRHMRVDAATFDRAVKPILDEFFYVENGRWLNVRLLAEYASASEKTERRKAAGQKGGKAKALKSNSKQPSNAKILLDHSSSKPEPKPRGEPIGSSTEAKASDADASQPMTVRQQIFAIGRPMLERSGSDKKSVGACLGALIKAKTEIGALTILTAMRADSPGEPETYIWKIIKGKAAPTNDPGAAPELELVMVEGKAVMRPVDRRAA